LHTAGQPTLTSSWKYNSGRNVVLVTIKQTQPVLYEFPLQIAVQTDTDTSTAVMDIKGKLTTLAIPVSKKPVKIVLDPSIDMLFEEIEK
jgi:aminopeptidase N